MTQSVEEVRPETCSKTTPGTRISPEHFVQLLEQGARGELRERDAHLLGATWRELLESRAQSVLPTGERNEVEAAQQIFREGVRDALARTIREILTVTPTPSVATPQTKSLSLLIKRSAAELHVALQKNLEGIPWVTPGAYDILGFTNRQEEAELLKRGDAIGALQLGFNTLETICRAHAPDRIGPSAVEQGLRSSPYGSERVSQLGTNFFKVLRNELLHDCDAPQILPTDQVQLALTYVLSRAGGHGCVERFNDPLFDIKEYDHYLAASFEYEFERRVREAEHTLNSDEYLKTLDQKSLSGSVANLDFDLSNPEERTLYKILLTPIENHVPIEKVCDFRVSKALEFVRQDATRALASAGVEVKRGEDPLDVLKSKRGRPVFGENRGMMEAWQETLKILVAAEKSGGYFQGNPVEAQRCRDAWEASQRAFFGDNHKSDPERARNDPLMDESQFVVRLCFLMSTSLRSLWSQTGVANPPEPIKDLRESIIHSLNEGPQAAARPFLQYAMLLERLFKETATAIRPSWEQEVSDKVAPATHARDLIFNSPDVLRNFERLGVTTHDLPNISKLAKSLFFGIRNSWAHDAVHRPRPTHVNEMLHAAALLHTITDCARGRGLPEQPTRVEWYLSDLAEAASLHPYVFERLTPTIVGTTSNEKLSEELENRIESWQVDASNSSGKSDRFFSENAEDLKKGVRAIRDTGLLPDPKTTAGVLARGALLSALVRLSKVPEFDLHYPLWKVYC